MISSSGVTENQLQAGQCVKKPQSCPSQCFVTIMKYLSWPAPREKRLICLSSECSKSEWHGAGLHSAEKSMVDGSPCAEEGSRYELGHGRDGFKLRFYSSY